MSELEKILSGKLSQTRIEREVPCLLLIVFLIKVNQYFIQLLVLIHSISFQIFRCMSHFVCLDF